MCERVKLHMKCGYKCGFIYLRDLRVGSYFASLLLQYRSLDLFELVDPASTYSIRNASNLANTMTDGRGKECARRVKQ